MSTPRWQLRDLPRHDPAARRSLIADAGRVVALLTASARGPRPGVVHYYARGVRSHPRPAPDEERFIAETERFRRELLAHCYRMVASAHDAEDLVQETYLRAWRSYAGFEGRASVRS